ncbi:helix-turn-helix transcriptional regulator [Clostridium sp. YIM B02551]|uniref:helix-turn-helix transcriptional regulator n=1 Tax=Clostridium sp. YIM B02551 TaxID=2910679 RepID=UPI001EEBBC2E|nr:AraC family transcriptional regulator [Clostridium sp. YIM B02551]
MIHSDIVQKALEYIELNLYKELTIDEISSEVGYSKYYFIRVFQKEVGTSLYEYIRKRRLSHAASFLRTTEFSILEIAQTLCFESQEAFTRAFKSIYQLPPGKYRSINKNLIIGGLFMDKQNEIKNWIVTGGAPEKYVACIDSETFHMGSKSATIYSVSDDIYDQEFGTIMQQVSAKSYHGKRMCFKGFVKTKDVEKWCGLWFRIDGKQGELLKFDNMQSRGISGTTGWNLYSCVLDVPSGAEILNIGVLLTGKGQIWLDNVSLEEVDETVPTTDFVAEEIFPEHILNSDFEEACV